MSELIDIRCPFKRKSKSDGIIRLCNHLCVKVYPGSSGETRCTRCNLNFEFEVDKQTDEQKTNIRVQA
jgi:hypothetical protein